MCVTYPGRVVSVDAGSALIDTDGRLWRARSYEDFETTFIFSEKTCEIDTLTPLFDQMREYQL